MKASIASFALAGVNLAAAVPQAGGGHCSSFEVVIARGTSEPGTYGSIVGDPFAAAVKRAVPGSTAFNVKYPASFSASSPDAGAQAVVQYFTTKPQQCLNQKYVIVGYSQGCVVQRRAMVNHKLRERRPRLRQEFRKQRSHASHI